METFQQQELGCLLHLIIQNHGMPCAHQWRKSHRIYHATFFVSIAFDHLHRDKLGVELALSSNGLHGLSTSKTQCNILVVGNHDKS